jgi:hypothetical protein
MFRCLSVAAAIAVLAVAAIWATGIGGSRMAIAEVVAAMGGRPWIRVTTSGSHSTERVWWFSPQKNISASRNGKSIEYHDHALGVYYSYDVEEKVLYRSPEFTPRRSSHYETLAAALQTLLDDEELTDDPLEQMEFLGRERANMELVDQSLKQVEEAGQAWLDYQLTLRHREREEGFTLVFRVDPETKLPQSYRMEGRWNGTQGVETARFEFPDEGPADVYDLGVPRATELVDRVPTDDVQRIVNNLRVGRHRMDNYRAIVVSHMGANDERPSPARASSRATP